MNTPMRVVALVLIFSADSAAADEYAARRLDSLGGSSCATRINGAGQIAGWSNTGEETHAVIWNRDGRILHDLGAVCPAGQDCRDEWATTEDPTPWLQDAAEWVTGINASGQVAGYLVDRGGMRRPFLWDGSRRTILPPRIMDREGAAAGITDDGTVFGWDCLGKCRPSGSTPFLSAVLWRGGGPAELITPEPPQGVARTLTGINRSGEMIGTFAEESTGMRYSFFLSRAGELSTLEFYPMAVNDRQQVVGFELRQSVVAFRWDPSGAVMLPAARFDSAWNPNARLYERFNLGFPVAAEQNNDYAKSYALQITGWCTRTLRMTARRCGRGPTPST